MGVHGLWQLLKPSSRPVTLENLEGKVLAIDVSVWLHQASKGMRDRFGNPVPNAHLVVLFKRICKLLFYRIKPIFVFDGGIPMLKKQTLAHRREQKEIAAEESDRISDKILKNLLKQQLLKEAVQKKEKSKKEEMPSVSVHVPGQPKRRDMFELEPLPEAKQRYLDELEAETPWEDFGHYTIHASHQDLNKIDTESEEFKNLPPEIQHELLLEIKESMKRTSWTRIDKMPKKADDFSNFQMKKILKQSSLTTKLDSVRNEMNNQNSGKIAKEFGCADSNSVVVQQLASEDDSHFIFVKGLHKRSAMEALEKHRNLEEDSKDFVKEETMSSKKSSQSETNQIKEELQPILKQENLVCEIKKEKDLVNKASKSKSAVDTDTESSSRYDSAFEMNKSLLFSWAQSVESQAKSEATSPLKTAEKQKKTAVQASKLSEDESSEDDLELFHSKRLEPHNPQQEHSKKTPQNEIKAEILDVRKQKLDSKLQEQTPDIITSLVLNSGKPSEEFKVPKDVNTISENVLEVVSDGSDEDFLDVAEVSANSLEDTYSTSLVPDMKPDVPSASQDVDGSEEKELPDDVAAVHTLPDEDEMEDSVQTSQEPNQFEGISQENIRDFQIELEAEQETLQQERGKQERLASSITDQMYLESQELLRLFGLPFITCPMEAEAQCAHLDITNQTDGTITEDSDIWLFGGKKVYKNFFNQNKQVEFYSYTEVKNSIGLIREQMIKIALLCGSDYTPGIQGVGPVTALEIMAEFPGEHLKGLENFKKWWYTTRNQVKVPQEVKLKSKLRQLEIHEGFPNAAVVDAYINPTVDTSEEPFSWAMPELDELRIFTSNKMGWLRSKTDEVLLPVLAQMNKPAQPQLQITDFFSSAPRPEISPEKCKSKRVKRALQRCLQHVALCPEPSTSLNEERKKRAKDIVEEMRKTGTMPKCPSKATQGQRRGMPSARRGQRRGAKVARTIEVKEELSLSESSSSNED